MRVRGRWILLAFCGLVFAGLALASLVERPALLMEKQDVPAPLPVETAWSAESRALPESAEAGEKTGVEKTGFAALLPAKGLKATGCVRERDGNGCPLQGRAFPRARYQAFPMEDMPG